MSRRGVRKFTNILALGLSGLATAIGLFFLGAILWTLIKNGLAGISTATFTEMTPPPGNSGGILNAIYGSVAMTLIGILIGAETRDIRCEDNQIEGFATRISDLHGG